MPTQRRHTKSTGWHTRRPTEMIAIDKPNFEQPSGAARMGKKKFFLIFFFSILFFSFSFILSFSLSFFFFLFTFSLPPLRFSTFFIFFHLPSPALFFTPVKCAALLVNLYVGWPLAFAKRRRCTACSWEKIGQRHSFVVAPNSCIPVYLEDQSQLLFQDVSEKLSENK